MRTPVLHLQADDEELPSSTLADGFIGQGSDLSVHVRRPDGSTEIWQYVQRGSVGGTFVSCRVTNDPFGCGCP